MPGTYAPPAVELPKTSAMVGMPIADSSVRSWKILPAGTNSSDWVGRSAPPDSTRLITGSRLIRAISSARSTFFSDQGFIAPPRTVGSCVMSTHSTPATTPMPVITLAPTVNSVPHAASGESSRNAESRSSSSSIRSRASSRPRSRCRCWYRGPPPARARSSCSSSCSSRASWAARLVRYCSPAVSRVDRSAVPSVTRGYREVVISVRPRQAQAVLGNEVEDHLPVHRGDAQQPGQAPQRHQAVLGGQAVAAVGLDGRVDGGQRRLGRGVLGHVAGLAGGQPEVVRPCGLAGHECGELGLDLRLGQGVADPLVRADRLLPDGAGAGVVRGAVE